MPLIFNSDEMNAEAAPTATAAVQDIAVLQDAKAGDIANLLVNLAEETTDERIRL